MEQQTHRTLGFLTLVAACASATGCGGVVSNDGELVEGERLEMELEERLDMPIKAQPPVVTSAALVNVRAVYTGESAGERLLAVVFDDPRATAQILGGSESSWEGQSVVRYRNAVVLYEHEPGMTGGIADLRGALRSAVDD
jgi:hypothetical protein